MGYVLGLPHNDKDTSKAAAIRALPTAGKDARKVLDHITGKGFIGAIDDEMEVALNMKHQTLSARRRGLVLDNWIEDSGMRRNTRSDRAAIVWVIK